MIIGLTGKNGSGKGEAARFLAGCGFEYLSLSDVLRDEVKRRKKPVTRGNLIAVGNDLRKEHGAGILGKKVAQKIQIDRHYVVDSIRHPSEVEELRSKAGFALIEIAASPKIRFQRIKRRRREKDPRTYAEFIAVEKKEGKSRTPTDQQLNDTLLCADYRIQNNGTLEMMREKIKKTVLEISRKKKRPDWDEYFLEIAKVAALRSNCVKRKVAAVIVKDKRIVSTGYNGTPRGIKNCNEGGCPRCNELTGSGKNLGECVCSHAEENAITQAAYHGVSIKGAMIYTTFSPCLLCTKMIINSGISEVVYNAEYPMAELPLKLLAEAGVKTRKANLS